MRRMYSENQLDTQIKEVIESGEIDNAKPIYFHPIVMITAGIFRLAITILDNNPTAYTWDTLKVKMKEIADGMQSNGQFNSNGFFKTSSIVCVADVIDYKYGTDKIIVYGANTSDGSNQNLELTNLTPTEFYDKVNKIN